jgi:hypothetical protein
MGTADMAYKTSVLSRSAADDARGPTSCDSRMMVAAFQRQAMHMQKHLRCQTSSLEDKPCLAGNGYAPAKAVCQDSIMLIMIDAVLNAE